MVPTSYTMPHHNHKAMTKKNLSLSIVISIFIVLLSLAYVQPIRSSDVCGVLICKNGSATYAQKRGFPLPILREPSSATQPGDINDNTVPKTFWASAGLDLAIW